MTTHTATETTQPAPRLRRLWEGWKRIAPRIGDVQARVMLTMFYVVIVTPFALAVRAFLDPMRFAAAPAWLPKDSPDVDTATYARRQY